MLVCLVVAGWTAFPGGAAAQDNRRLFELEPFDLLTLKEGAAAPLKLSPLEIRPRAPLSNRPPDEELQIRLLDKPDRRFAVAWRDIVEVKLFEQMLLEDAAELVRARRFDEAFEYYQLLEAEYDSFPGVSDAIENCLFQEAGHWHSQMESDRALALLAELHRRNPGFARLRAATSAVAGKLIDANMAAGRTGAARRLLEDFAARHPEDALVTKWQPRFTTEAEQALAKAQAHYEAGQWLEAHQHARTAMEWWPKLSGVRELYQELQSRSSVLTVGVAELAPTARAAGVPTWSGRRVGRLVNRSLVEAVGPGDMGAHYVSPLGQLTATDSGRRIVLRLDAGFCWSEDARPLSACDVSKCLLDLADPRHADYQPGWSELLAGIDMGRSDDDAAESSQVLIDLVRPHPLPAALLHSPVFPWDYSAAGGQRLPSLGPYLLDSRDADRARYRRHAGPTAVEARFEEIIERRYADMDEALSALVGAHVAAIDRLRPWDVARVQSNEALAVEPYAFPSVHFLLPNRSRPWMAQTQFRRALIYGIDRQRILVEHLRVASDTEAGHVLSGPFPRGYAYDAEVAPRAYDPSLAVALAGAALAELSATKRPAGAPASAHATAESAGKPNSTTGGMPPLVLVHPPTDIARIACRAIQEQLALRGSGIAVELKEQPAGDPPVGDWDLWYIEWPAMEPLIDARRLLGPGRLAGIGSHTIDAALRRLDAAQDWPEARRELWRLHRLAHAEVAVLPLWQLTEYLAYRRTLSGVGQQPVTLYQQVEQWQGPSTELP